MNSVANKKISVFLFLTFAFSAIFYYFIITSRSIHPYSLGLMWCPGIAAIITQFIFQRNIRIQQFFTPLTGATNLTPYVIDEFGLGLALAALLLAYVFWQKRDELPANSEAA